MRLYLLRHADAAPGHPDEQRPLTERGLTDLGRLCDAVKPKIGRQLEGMWVSPLLRAQQTADFVTERLDLDLERRTRKMLLPEANPARTAREALESDIHLLLVGHNPHLELLASYLLTGRSNGAMILMSTGTLMCLENTSIRPDIGACMLRWMISPKALKAK